MTDLAKSTEAKKSRSELKREAIIEAARNLFKELGVAATSMDKLAEAAQVSKRTVYNHFATKEALVWHLITEHWYEAMKRNQLNYQPNISLEQQLTDIIRVEIDSINSEEHIDLAKVALGHLFFSTSELCREIEKIKLFETALLRWIKAASLDNKIKVNDMDFAHEQLMHLVKGHAFWPQLLSFRAILTDKERGELASETAKMFLARYRVIR